MSRPHLSKLALPRRTLMQLAAASGALPLFGARAQATPKKGGQAVVGLSQEPTVMDPLRPHIEVDEGVYMALYNPLWGVDPKGNLLPQLAAEVPTVANGGLSADGLTWTVKLRPGVTWHDGAPFTADDVKFTLDTIMQPDFPAYSRTGHELVRDIKVVSPTEITWRMEKPFAPYSSILAWTYMVPAHARSQPDPTGASFAAHPIGTGPFKFGERVPGDHITLLANDKYFGDGPYLDRVIYKYIPDLTVLYTQFRTGDIDYIGLQGISADHYQEAKTLADRNVVVAPVAFIENFYFNLGKPQFQDRAVREALYASMDKASIISELYYGLPKPSETYLPAASWAFNPNLPQQSYDPAKAKAMLDQAGWKPGAGGIREKDGVRLEFINSTTAGNHLREQVQQLLQQNWQDIGVGMTIKNLPPAVMWADYWIKSHFETAIVGIDFMVGPDPDASDYFSSASISAKTGSGQNTMQYSNPKVDALLQKGAATLDRDARIAVYHELQATLRDDLPFLPIYQAAQVEGTKSALQGYQPNINVRLNTWNIATWHWA